MIDAILVNKSTKVKFEIKSLISFCLIVCAVGLPHIVHLFFGAAGGVTLLPMYLPVIIGGCLLGFKWGLMVGIASPLLSFLITSSFGSPMPAIQRLPFMVIELMVFATVAGSFSKLITKNSLYVIPAVLLSQIAGRLSFVLLVAIFQNVTSLSLSLVLSQIQSGIWGILAQLVIVPLVIISLSNLVKENGNE